MRAISILATLLLVATACGGATTPPAATAAATAPATQDPTAAVAAFYGGKTVKIIVGYPPPGGYDGYARTLAAHIGKHIPGNPTIIVENMEGAGSLKALNYLYNAAAKDGTVFGTFGRGLPEAELRGDEGVQFKSRELNWIGSMNEEISVCVVRATSPVKTLADVQKQTVTVGATGPNDDTGFMPRLLNALVGTKFDIKTGYPGGGEILLAMERGEVMGRCGWSWSSVLSTKKAWIDTKYVTILTQLSLKKHPDLQDIPLAIELVTNPDDRQVLEVIFARQAIGRPYAAPPGVPAERVKALQEAFEKTLKDPDFLAAAAKAKQEIINPRNGAETRQVIEKIFSTPANLVNRLKQIAG